MFASIDSVSVCLFPNIYQQRWYVFVSFKCVSTGAVVHQFHYTDLDHGINAEADFNMSKSTNDLQKFELLGNGSLIIRGELKADERETYQVFMCTSHLILACIL